MFEATKSMRKAHKLPEGWRPIRLECLGTQRTHIRIDGAVYPVKITRGPRKGKPNFNRPTPGTQRTIIVSNAEYDRWMAEVRAIVKQQTPLAKEKT